MGHAESPSLISLGLAADVSQEGSSFRWGLATSCFLHALVIAMAVFLRFQSTIEEPFRAIDVALISMPEAQTPAPNKEKASPPAPSAPKAQPTKTQRIEDTLPPLPTQTASERLSEFLGDAIGSIMVPHKQEIATPPTPPEITDPNSPKDHSPLIENLRLPPTAPKLLRPERLHPADPLKIPKTDPTPPRQTAQTTVVPSEPKKPDPASSSESVGVKPAVKAAPALPELSPVIPFKRTEKEMRPNDSSASKNLEKSFKDALPTVPTHAQPPKIQRKSRALPPQPKKSSVPEMSAPQLAKIQPSHPREKSPPRAETSLQRVEQTLPHVEQEQATPREKMAKMMEQLMGEVKVPNLKPAPASPRSQQPVPSSSSSTKPIPSEMDQRIAKLSIPSITPVESIKNRLQLLEVQATSNPGNSSSQPSPRNYQYQEIVQSILQDQWENKTPLVADAPMVVLKFRISRSGEVSQIRIAESSGNAHYDSAAQRAVHAVNPLPPFPSEISDSYLDVRWKAIKEKKE